MGSNSQLRIITGTEVEIIMRDGSSHEISSPRMPSTDGSWMTVIDNRYGREIIRCFNLSDVQHYSIEHITEDAGEMDNPDEPDGIQNAKQI